MYEKFRLFSHLHCEYRHLSCQGSHVASPARSGIHALILCIIVHLCQCVIIVALWSSRWVWHVDILTKRSCNQRGLPCTGAALNREWQKGIAVAAASQYCHSAALLSWLTDGPSAPCHASQQKSPEIV